MEKRVSDQIKVMGKDIVAIVASLIAGHSYLQEYGIDADIIADIKEQSVKLINLRAKRRELIQNVKNIVSLTATSPVLSDKEKQALAKKNAMLALRYPSRIVIPAWAMVATKDTGRNSKANALLHFIKENVVSSLLNGNGVTKLSLVHCMNAAGVKNTQELKPLLGAINKAMADYVSSSLDYNDSLLRINSYNVSLYEGDKEKRHIRFKVKTIEK